MVQAHVLKKKLRSANDIKGFLERHIYPSWSGRDFTSIKRSDIAKLLDHLEDEHGARQAKAV